MSRKSYFKYFYSDDIPIPRSTLQGWEKKCGRTLEQDVEFGNNFKGYLTEDRSNSISNKLNNYATNDLIETDQNNENNEVYDRNVEDFPHNTRYRIKDLIEKDDTSDYRLNQTVKKELINDKYDKNKVQSRYNIKESDSKRYSAVLLKIGNYIP